MIKRILGGAAAAAFTLTLLGANPASAACPTQPQSTVTPLAGPAGPSGTTVYGAQTGTTSGYIGVTGSTGWIEAGGSTSGAYARGSATGQPVNGEIIVSTAPKVCVANTTVR